MKLNLIIDGHSYPYEVPDHLLDDAVDFFDKLNKDMDQGWQMSRDWVDKPDIDQRCQIVADKILTAIDTENEKLLLLMAAYILRSKPGIISVAIDNTGDMNLTEFVMKPEVTKPLGPIF